jgi:hypothetical protein
MRSVEKYRIEISNRFATLENLDAEVVINRVLETIRDNLKISAKENIGYYEYKNISHLSTKNARIIRSKQQTKLQWLHDQKK